VVAIATWQIRRTIAMTHWRESANLLDQHAKGNAVGHVKRNGFRSRAHTHITLLL
jgi:hypothetical protein